MDRAHVKFTPVFITVPLSPPLLMQGSNGSMPSIFFNIDVWECSYHLPEVPSSYLPSLISITTRLTFQIRVLLREEVMEPLQLLLQLSAY